MIDIVLKSDQEPTMKTIVEDTCRARAKRGAMRTVVEHSPLYSSKSNGVVERAVKSVEGQMRVMRSALESRRGVVLEVNHAVWPWLVEYASYLLNRHEVGKDGYTAYERCKGKRAQVRGVEFGEAVMWKRRPRGTGQGKLSCLWEDVVFLGVKSNHKKFIIGDGKQVRRTPTIQRKTEKMRWDKNNISMVAGVPWKNEEEEEDYMDH